MFRPIHYESTQENERVKVLDGHLLRSAQATSNTPPMRGPSPAEIPTRGAETTTEQKKIYP